MSEVTTDKVCLNSECIYRNTCLVYLDNTPDDGPEILRLTECNDETYDQYVPLDGQVL